MARKFGSIAATLLVLAAVAGASTVPALADGPPPPSHPFPQHARYVTGVMPSVSQSERDAAVMRMYDGWKSRFLKPKCAGQMVIASEAAPHDGTVSEAIGYGMNIVPLTAGYDPDAKAEFDGLWTFVSDHLDAKGMMQWQIDGATCGYADSSTPDSATDGDLDIGYGLVLADSQWGGYRSAALNWLAKLYAVDVAPAGFLKLGDDAPLNATRPSDMMLDHLRAFAASDPAHNWRRVIRKTTSLIREFTKRHSPRANLLSDFVVKANTKHPKPAPADYLGNQPANIVSYNSVRVPWHLGTDALLFGNRLSTRVAARESASYRRHARGNPRRIRPQIRLDGTWYGRDKSEAASAPVGVAAMAAGDQKWTNALWSFAQTNAYREAYYGETLRMLAVLVMAGDYWSPA